ncbi:MAG: PD-(D/E)XK nuclease family protein [Burkholderiales bacterium]|nr:PD-(D/E)XK nuclease family protein [Burkholderiales bacterium]
MQQRHAHPARTLVLLPYAHLLPLAGRLWAQCFPDGFAPQFETTQNWRTRMGGFAPGTTDITFDMALDTLTASALLRSAGLGAQQDALAGLLVQAAQQLGPLAAACPPDERARWAQSARSAATLGMEIPALAMEVAVARIAVEWAAQSAYASDLLFDAEVRAALDCLLVVQGFAADPLAAALQATWGARMATLPLAAPQNAEPDTTQPAIAWHPCHDAEDEAQRTAACAIAHIAAGRYPMALVSSDRALTRRVRSMLESAQVQIRDETGWKLSTSPVLRLVQPALPAWERLVGQALWSARRMDLAEFTAWVNQALEGASFSPPYPRHEQLVILPMSQMLARPFAAVVLAGCDEVRLNPSPEPPGGWTTPQRAALGLPSRDALQAATAAAWQHALQTPFCDVLWRCSDDAGEPLLPSALVQQAQITIDNAETAADPRQARTLAPAPVLRPEPSGQLVPVAHLSASAYDDLRQCPYRFFAMRQLGLQSVDELDTAVDKRDFGLWLHEVLKHFHEALAHQPTANATEQRDLLEAAAAATTQSMDLGEGEFLPFAASWPTVREGYLRWLAQHLATGAVFASAETDHSQRLGDVKLIGRIDRTDRLPDGTPLVLDYKTENSAKTASRVKEPLEDTQMAFYAALLPDDTLQGAYINVGERDGTRTYPQPELVEARDALIEGVLNDMARIAAGAPMPALGEGSACDFCQARGLCRKDFWI